MQRSLLASFATAVLTALIAGPLAHAQSVDTSKPIRFIVPLGPGSGSDTTTRFVAERYAAVSGQPTIAENRPGGDMVIAVQTLLTAPPDGNSILLITPSSVVINPVLRSDLPYDAQRDIRPVAWVTRGFAVMVTGADSRFKTFGDVVAAARAKPGSVSFANYGHHYRLGALSLEKAIGATFNHVTYKGAAQANNDVIGGAVDVHVTDIGGAMPLIKSGKLRALAVTGNDRHEFLPDVPTIAESGYPDYNLYVWIGFGIHAKTPEPIVKKIEANLIEVLKQPEFATFSAQQGGSEVVAGTGQRLAAHIAAETERYRALVK